MAGKNTQNEKKKNKKSEQSEKNKSSKKATKKTTKKKQRKIERGKLTKTKVQKAVAGSGGIVARVAEKLDCTRKSLYDFLQKNPGLWNDIHHEKEMLMDIAEDGLKFHLENRDLSAIRFALRTRGAERGYGEKQELEHSGGEDPVKINIMADNDTNKS